VTLLSELWNNPPLKESPAFTFVLLFEMREMRNVERVMFAYPVVCVTHRRTDNSRTVSFTVSAWEWVYATNLSRLQSETSKRHVAEAHSALITAVLLPQGLSCYWDKIVSLRMITNLRLVDLRLSTAQQRSAGQNLPSDLYRCTP
jgi:hypothetical protein